MLPAQNGYLLEIDPPGVSPYMDLAQDTPVQLFDADGWHAVTPTSQPPLWLFGETYDPAGQGTFLINRNGRIRFGNDDTHAEVELARTGLEPIDGTSRVSYHRFTGPGGGILVVQYRNLRLLNGINGNYMNAQFWYYGGPGTIEFRYGPSSPSNGGGFAGDRGPHIGMYHTPVDMSECLERVWLSGDPDGPQVDYTAICEFPAMNGLPDEGTVLRFLPLFTIPAGIAENDASPFRMDGNLVGDRLTVNVDDPAGMDLAIMDASGRTIRRMRATTGINAIGTGDLAPGSYLLTGTAGDMRHARRFVKA